MPRQREPWPGPAHTRERAGRRASGVHSALSGQFFQHASARPAGRPGNPTRYLCAAAYLNPWYANRVIGELVASHRAVAPSVDIDLGPVIRHCLHARKIAAARDVVLTILLVAGLIFALLPTIAVLIIAFGLGFLRGPAWQRRSAGAKVGIVAGIVATIIGIVVLVGLVTVLSRLAGTAVPGAPGGGIGKTIVLLILFLALTATTVITHTYVKFRTLSDRLRPGAAPARFEQLSKPVESRIAQVEAAQWGNVTLYSGENPFIGAGKVNRIWSIAIELDRARPAGQEFMLRPGPRRYVPIDPVELHQFIRGRLLKLNDPELPPNERISALTVEDHVVGEGLRRWEGPLIDPAEKMPYSQAGGEAIEALIRHPQAGLRYYQRVSLSDEGQAVLSNGQEVIARADQEVAVSAFVHVAVEGRMFYLEFVTTVLPPIQHRYHIVDRLPKISSGAFLAKVILESATTMFGDLVSAPVRLYRTARMAMREQRSFADEAASYDDYLFGDVGARISVRELAASLSPHTHIQTLDVTKYTKIIERLLTDVVLDFLREKGADTTAYASSASVIVNNAGVVNYGDMTGPLAVGLGGPVTQTVQQHSAPPPAAAAG